MSPTELIGESRKYEEITFVLLFLFIYAKTGGSNEPPVSVLFLSFVNRRRTKHPFSGLLKPIHDCDQQASFYLQLLRAERLLTHF